MKTPTERLHNPKNRLARFYDNGEPGDRYTASYLRPQRNGLRKWFDYRAMSTHPFDPQGIGIYGDNRDVPVDWPAARMGRRNHLGRRIAFADLPPDCQKLVLQDLFE